MAAASVSARSGESEICCICHDTLDMGVRLKCNHIFHILCISRWYIINKTCPLDRQSFEMSEARQLGPAHPFSILSIERISQLYRLIATAYFDGYENRLILLQKSDRGEMQHLCNNDRTMAESGLRSGSTIWAVTSRSSPNDVHIPNLRFELTIREP